MAYGVAAWLVVEVGSVLLEIYVAPEWVLKVLVGLLLLGFPLAVLFSWVYELTPDGLRKESEIRQGQAVTHQTSGRLTAITLVLLLALGAFVITDRFVLSPGSHTAGEAGQPNEPGAEPVATTGLDEGRPSIAVLPFADMSSAQDQAYFSDGIAEELLNLLAKVPDLRVAARTSSFRFRGQQQDITEIARTLGVQHVLEGSVRKSGERVRVTAQLIDARDGFHIWSESYDEDLVEILAVQDRIAGQIVSALSDRLGVALTSSETRIRRLSDSAAYDFFLRGNYAKHLRTPEDIRIAVNQYRQAVALEPDFAAAWGGLARAALLANDWYPDESDAFEALYQESVERALSIDPAEPQALGAKASEIFDRDKHFAKGLEAFERVIEADPSDTEAMSWLAQRYRWVGYLDKAEAMNRRAYAIDPFSPRVIMGMARTLSLVGKTEESRRIAEKAMRDLSGHPYAVVALIESHLMSGDLESLAEIDEKLSVEDNTGFLMDRIRIAAALGKEDAVRSRAEQLTERVGDQSSWGVEVEAITHYLLGECDRARETMRRANALGGSILQFPVVRPGVYSTLSKPARNAVIDFSPWIEDYPGVIEGYATLGIDIVAEVQAAGRLEAPSCAYRLAEPE